MDKNVIVLLSSYNGERYIREQIDSILGQTYDNVKLLIRDDGSSDSTISIIEDYCMKNPNISFYTGENLKPAKSFLHLLQNAPEADYYALADQDDVWKPEKIERGIELLEKTGGNLYYSNFQMSDEFLNPIYTPPKPIVSTIGEAAVLITATGCTMILSNKLRLLLKRYTPKHMIMHDSWIHKVALSTCNPVVFDNNAYILYRQHGNNVLGGKGVGLFRRWIGRLIRVFHVNRVKSDEMIDLYEGFSDLMDINTKIVVGQLVEYVNKGIMGRMRVALNPAYKTAISKKNLLFRVAVILKRY